MFALLIFLSTYFREWIGTYTTIEIEYALELGYQVKHIYECYHFAKKEPILKQYLKVLSYLKLRYSVSKESDPSVFEELNLKMEFSDLSLQLTSKNVEEDEMLKEHFKLLMNCALGKFAQKRMKTKTIFVRNQVGNKNRLNN